MAENKEATTEETTAAPEAAAPANGVSKEEGAPAVASATDEVAAATEAKSEDAPTPEANGAAAAESEPDTNAPELKTDGAPELPKEGDMSFAEMFELAEKQSAEKRKAEKEAIGGNIRPGQVLFAKVVGFSHDSVFLDIGAKAEGVIAKSELVDENGELNLKEGDKVEARVRKFDGGTVILSKVLPHQSLKNREELKEAHRTNIPVEGRVTGQNKGGFDVEVAGIRAFCPASQMDLRPGKGENYIGRKFHFRITEMKDNGRNIVVSRRALLIEENKKKAEKVLSTLNAGDTVQGTVTSLKDYGAFVDIGGVEGLVHLSEISHGHIHKPREVLKVGDPVAAKVLRIEDGKDPSQKKISLSIKALSQDPWTVAQDQIKEGQKVTGKVARIQTFGAFVEILPGVDGLIHISNMALGRRIANPRDVVQEGEEVEATVVTVDWSKRRIGLSLVKTPQELANELRQGTVFEGTVDRIESFGVFVKLPSGARGLVPAAETGTQRGTDLKKEFDNNQKVKVVVQEVDTKSGKIRLSIRAAAEAEERAEIEGYLGKESGKGKGLGTLGDLLKNKFPNLVE
ncbi:MAG: S1 RNA-binding domain-containing protein [Deltaproteobacteria bacterium]